MDRLAKVKEYVYDIVEHYCYLPDKQEIITHLYGVSEACVLLATKRGLNTEIACICGLMHDLYACVTGSYMQHGPSGAEMARVALRRMGCFTDDEQILIRSAIYHHSDKKHVHDAYDELLKDADVLSPFLHEGGKRLQNTRALRMHRLAEELEIQFAPELREQHGDSNPSFSRSKLADIAERIASQNVEGSVDNALFCDILRYWPEPEAFSELKNYWCAAFVYHCCLLAGMELPIRYPGVDTRFACVAAWLEWARMKSFYFDAANPFEPVRGDIVIYNNIIPTEKKPAGGPWHDHIGIVLSADADSITVAEGNVGNENISGIVSRNRREHVGGYIRIPDNYISDCRKYDYKTNIERINPYQ